MEARKIRNSAIELLKLFAMFLIILSHSMPKYDQTLVGYVDIVHATDNIQNLVLIVFNYLGQLGNAIFVICSSWFLIGGDKTQKGYKNCYRYVDDFGNFSNYLCNCFGL